jgi:hypothetical protein
LSRKDSSRGVSLSLVISATDKAMVAAPKLMEQVGHI